MIDLAERIRRLSTPDNSGCWLWQGHIQNKGYGVIGVREGGPGQHRWSPRYAHRMSYQVFRGPIPEGLTIDHLCRVKRCVNPEHLEAVTERENYRRGIAEHCRRGHPWTPENTYLRRSGKRMCRTCIRWRKRGKRGPI